MKNLKWIIPVVALCIVGLTVGIILSLNHRSNKTDYVEIVPVATESLSKPVNLSMQNGVLTWDEVENADHYLVMVGDEEYKVYTNSFQLTGLNNDGLVSVKAVGKGTYIDSSSSISLFYRSQIDDDQVNQIEQVLNNFLKELKMIEPTLTKQFAEILYLNGFDATSIKDLVSDLKQLIIDNTSLPGFDKLYSLQDILLQLIKVSRIDLSPFVKAFGIINVLNLYFQNKLNYPTNVDEYLTKYYTAEEIEQNYQAIVKAFNEIDIYAYQAVASVLNYIELLVSQFTNVIHLGGGFITSQTDMTSDMLTLKDTFCKILLNALPNKNEFSVFASKLSVLYQKIAPGYVLNKLNPVDLVSLLKEVYNWNHKIISFISTITEEDYKTILQNVKAIINSIDFDKIKEQLNLFNINEIINNIEQTVVNLAHINYNKYLNEEVLNELFTILESESLTDVVEGLSTYFDLKSFLTIDFEGFDNPQIEDLIKNVIKNNSFALDDDVYSQFKSLYLDGSLQTIDMDYVYLLVQLMSLNVITVDYHALGNSIIQKIGITDEFKNEIIVSLKPILDNIEEYKNIYHVVKTFYDLYQFLMNIKDAEYSQVLKLIVQYKSIADDLAVNIDFISIYSLYTTLNLKYAKFNFNYEYVFDNNGFNLDYLDCLKGLAIYVLSGQNAENLEIVVDEMIPLVLDATTLLAKYAGYLSELLPILDEINENLRNDDFDKIAENIEEIYSLFKRLMQSLKEDELINKSYNIATSFVNILSLITDISNTDDLKAYLQATFHYSNIIIEFIERSADYINEIDDLSELFDSLEEFDIKKISEIFITLFKPFFNGQVKE